MVCPLRIEFEGAFYHVMARGNAHQRIFLDEEEIRGQVVRRNGQPDRPPMRRRFSLFQVQRTLHDLTPMIPQ
ncbi:MAG: hypothetical protein AB7Q04_14090 [Steroidobacteraceae bacterium]